MACSGRLPAGTTRIRQLLSSLRRGWGTMRTVITGGAGFIGSHLCERFLAKGHEVVCVDKLSTGALANVEPLRKNDRFTFIRHDISHPLELDEAVDNVLHFASPASPVDYL